MAPAFRRPSIRARQMSVKIVLKVQHLLASAMTALVACDPVARVPNLDVQRMHARLHPGVRLDRHRIEVGLDRHAPRLSTRGNTTSARSNPSTARGSKWGRSTVIAAPTGPELTKQSFCTHKRTKLEHGCARAQPGRAFRTIPRLVVRLR